MLKILFHECISKFEIINYGFSYKVERKISVDPTAQAILSLINEENALEIFFKYIHILDELVNFRTQDLRIWFKK